MGIGIRGEILYAAGGTGAHIQAVGGATGMGGSIGNSVTQGAELIVLVANCDMGSRHDLTFVQKW